MKTKVSKMLPKHVHASMFAWMLCDLVFIKIHQQNDDIFADVAAYYYDAIDPEESFLNIARLVHPPLIAMTHPHLTW